MHMKTLGVAALCALSLALAACGSSSSNRQQQQRRRRGVFGVSVDVHDGVEFGRRVDVHGRGEFGRAGGCERHDLREHGQSHESVRGRQAGEGEPQPAPVRGRLHQRAGNLAEL